MNKEIIHLFKNKYGKSLVTLPDWAWNIFYKQSGIRSKKKRHVKKAVKKEFFKAIYSVIAKG